MPRYSELVYNGFWFSPERLALQVRGWVGGWVWLHGCSGLARSRLHALWCSPEPLALHVRTGSACMAMA